MRSLGRYRSYIIGSALWIAAIASIFIVAEIKFPKGSKLDIDLRLEQVKVAELFGRLSEGERNRINYYEGGFIKLPDGRYHLIMGDGSEINLLEKGLLGIKEIPLSDDDPLLAERRYRIQSAYKQLNTTERVCHLYKQALLFYQDGRVFLAINPLAYEEYAKKYGIDCPSCEEKDRIKPKMKGGE